ncbi:MAG: M16 family metallopeptidase [Rickettsiales bacterium]
MMKWRKLLIVFLVSILVMFGTDFKRFSESKNDITFENSEFSIENFMLENGMEVVLIPNHRVPAVMHMVWYKVGGINEQLGKTGLAHYLEHLMFHGTRRYKKNDLDNLVSEFGGSHNAFTSYDFTAYYQNVPKEYLDEVMDIESDRMRNLVLVEEQTKIERNVVLEERLMRRDNSPRSVLDEKVKEDMLGKEHPYGRPLIGYEEDIQALTHQEAIDFYNKYYFPNNAILILAGDLNIEEAKKLAEKYYATIPAGPENKIKMAEERSSVIKNFTIHYDKNTTNTEIKLSYLAPDLLAQNKEHSYALSVLSYLLAGKKNSILYKKLITELDIALSVSSSYSDMSRGQSFFEIDIILKDDKHEKEVLKIIQDELKALAKGKINDKSLARAKKIFLIETIYSKESYKSLAYMVGMNYTTGISLAEIKDWDKKIKQVTKSDIAKAVNFVFTEAKQNIGYLKTAKEE